MNERVEVMARVLSTKHLAEGITRPLGTLSYIVGESDGRQFERLVIVDDRSNKKESVPLVRDSFLTSLTVPEHFFEKLSSDDRSRWKKRCFLISWKPSEKIEQHAIGYKLLPVTGKTIRMVRNAVSVLPVARIK